MLLLSVLARILGLFAGLRLLVSYVATNSFPQPLSESDEQRYLRQWKEGDWQARGILIEHNLRLVAHMVKKYDSSAVEQEDLISIGTIGLIKGVNTFDMHKGIRLATYAARCIDNEILMHLRATKKLRAMIYLNEPTGVDKEGNELTLIETLSNNEEPLADTVETALQQERLQQLLARLDRREQVVLMLRFGLVDGVRLTQREIARELKISRSYVSRIEKKAMQRLYSEVCKEGGFERATRRQPPALSCER